LRAQFLVALALLKRVAGAVAVLEEIQGGTGEFAGNVILDDGALVFDGCVVAVEFFVD
jgi:hypothetical protein